MNLLLIKPEEIQTDNSVILKDRRHVHIRDILKSQAGDSLRIGVLNGPIGSGIIINIDRRQTLLNISLNSKLPSRPKTDLILALPRPIMLKRILAQAAALGVGHIYLINANRVEKSFFTSALIADNNFEEPLCYGLEQAMDTLLPEVSVHHRFRPFVEDLLPKIINDYQNRLLAHPASNENLAEVATPPLTERILLAVGPEGGWVDFEIRKFQAQGFTLFHLGQRILRVETAVTALLAQLDLLRQV